MVDGPYRHRRIRHVATDHSISRFCRHITRFVTRQPGIRYVGLVDYLSETLHRRARSVSRAVFPEMMKPSGW